MIRLVLDAVVLTNAEGCALTAVAAIGARMLLDAYRYLVRLTDDQPGSGDDGEDGYVLAA